jgi:hypothetical protein
MSTVPSLTQIHKNNCFQNMIAPTVNAHVAELRCMLNQPRAVSPIAESWSFLPLPLKQGALDL